MLFDNYKDFQHAKIDTTLLWEYKKSDFDYQAMRHIVVERVIQLGLPEDWYAMFNLYGIDGVKQATQKIAYLNERDMHFISFLLDLPLESLECYRRRQSMTIHWRS